LFPAVDALVQAGVAVKALRDATRGGVAAVLHEWSEACRHTLVIDAPELPVTPDVRGACELLGLDPLYSACEGTMVVAVEAAKVPEVLRALRSVPVSVESCRLGCVLDRQLAPVAIRRATGQLVPVDDPAGAPLPRIC
jgi:hydrogenase expression/formation protein HypE